MSVPGASVAITARSVADRRFPDRLQVEVAEHGMQLPEAGAVSLLRPRLQSWQIIVGEAFESFFVGSSGIPTTIEPTMFTGEELLGSGCATGNAPNRSNCAYRRSPLACADPLLDVASKLSRIAIFANK